MNVKPYFWMFCRIVFGLDSESEVDGFELLFGEEEEEEEEDVVEKKRGVCEVKMVPVRVEVTWLGF